MKFKKVESDYLRSNPESPIITRNEYKAVGRDKIKENSVGLE